MADRIEDLMVSDHRDKIIRITLSSLDKLSGETRSRFESVIRKGGGVKGFQDPFKAPRPLLQSHIVELMNRFPNFNSIVLDIWAGTQPDLRDLAREHISGLKVELDDDTPPEFWSEQAAQLAESNDEFDQTDIELMMYHIAHMAEEMGSEILEPDDSEGEDDGPAVAARLEKTLDYLRALPANKSEWSEDIPRFAEMLAELIAEKESSRAHTLLDDLKSLQSDFASELAFFNWQPYEWDADDLAEFGDIAELAHRLDELKPSLKAYRPIREPADNITAERERRHKRHEYEEIIERLLDAMSELMQTPGTSEDNPTEGVVADKDAPPTNQANDAHTPNSDTDPETHPTQQPADAETTIMLQDEIRALKENYDALLDSNRELKQDNDLMTDAFRALQGEVAGLDADKQTLAEEAADFKEKLRISEQQEIYWRNMYDDEKSSKASATPQPVPPEIESVKQAIELAKARYGDSLLIHLNKKSDPDYNYSRPKEVWDALDWLARIYRPTQTGEARVKDLNESLRNICGGWEYKPNQTDITVNTNRAWYTTTVDGITYELRKHVGRGISRRENNIIRIAFAWDKPSRRVVVGYIGPHQRNRSS